MIKHNNSDLFNPLSLIFEFNLSIYSTNSGRLKENILLKQLINIYSKKINYLSNNK